MVTVKAAFLESTFTKLLSNVIQNLEVMGDVRCIVLRNHSNVTKRLAFDNCLSVGVSELGGRLDDSATEPLLDGFSFLGHSEDDRESEAFLTWQETAQLLTQSRRQHRNSALSEINTGGTLASITIQSSVGLDEERNIRNVNTDVICTIFVEFDREGVIEIFSRVRIDGENTFGTKIPADFELSLRDARANY